MMRFSLIEESGVKSAQFSSPTPFPEDDFSLDFVFVCWNELLASNKIPLQLKRRNCDTCVATQYILGPAVLLGPFCCEIRPTGV